MPKGFLVVLIVGLTGGMAVHGEAVQPTLKVQAVDLSWLPLPGLRVRVTPVESCKGPTHRRDATLVETTDRDGNASFHAADNRNYHILIGGEWGFEKAEQCAELGRHPPDHPTAYVQMRVAVVVPKK